ncbi:MAG TPA: response regulator [Anaerolineales bacterium]|nr:response regulator [Anaerolineales bacterium]
MLNTPYAIVIEDDPQLSVIYKTALQQAGFNTALDVNGDLYPTLLDDAEPTLVLLDLHLPFALGTDILEIVRARYPKTVIAVITADFMIAKTLAEKADHVLIKPVSISSILKIALPLKG